MPSTLQPWEQQPGEPSQAYSAFVTYRDLGPSRSVLDAFRQSESKPGAKQASGRWNKWVKDHHWHARAVAHDAHLERQKQKGIDRGIQREAESWVAIQSRQLREDLARWRRYLAKTDLFADWPIQATTTTHSQDGRTVTNVYEPLDPEKFRVAERIAREATIQIRETIAIGLGVESEAGTQAQQATARQDDPGTQQDAGRKVEAFRAEQRRRMLTMPTGPPGADEGERDEP